MAAAVWPSYAIIQADVELSAGTAVGRTELDDGAVRQARTVTRPVRRQTVTAQIPDARLVEFQAWAQSHADRYFLFADAVDSQQRGVRVVNGVAGIVIRQVARAPARPLWEASLTLEDAGGVAAGAPFFAIAAIEHVLDDLNPLVLPRPYGGRAPLTTDFAGPLPAGMALDAATRTLSCRHDIVSVDEMPYRWRTTDADDRSAVMIVNLAVARRLNSRFTRPSDGVIQAAFVGQRGITAAWFEGTPTDRYIRSLTINKTGQIELDIGPADSSENFTADTARRLRLWLRVVVDAAGTVKTLVVPGPAAATGVAARDLTEPYSWTLTDVDAVAEFVDSLPVAAGLSVSIWRAAA